MRLTLPIMLVAVMLLGGTWWNVEEPTPQSMTAGLINSSATSSSVYFALFCGAVVVDPEHALTAAHCVEGRDPDSFEMIGGSIDICNAPLRETDRIRIRAVTVHPEYDKDRLGFDVAVLRLARPANAGSIPIGVRPETGAALEVAGWGSQPASGLDGCTTSGYDISVVADHVCASSVGLERLAPDQFCGMAARESPNTCQRDSGGPAFLRDGHGGLSLVGLTSWGTGCEARDPGGYVALASVQAWLNEVIRG